MQSGSSNLCGCNEGAAAEADTVGGAAADRAQSESSSCNQRAAAAAEVDATEEKQLKLWKWGRTRLVTHNLCTCTLCCECVITNGHNWGEAAEVGAIREQQLTWM